MQAARTAAGLWAPQAILVPRVPHSRHLLRGVGGAFDFGVVCGKATSLLREGHSVVAIHSATRTARGSCCFLWWPQSGYSGPLRLPTASTNSCLDAPRGPPLRPLQPPGQRASSLSGSMTSRVPPPAAGGARPGTAIPTCPLELVHQSRGLSRVRRSGRPPPCCRGLAPQRALHPRPQWGSCSPPPCFLVVL